MSLADEQEAPFVDTAALFGAVADLREHLALGQSEPPAVATMGHGGADEVLAAIVDLVAGVRAAVGSEGEVLASAAEMVGVETMIADYAFEMNGSTESWYGL